jgi:hypothetical protein
MPNWISDLQGLVDVRAGATTIDRRKILQVPADQAEASADAVVLFPDAPVSIGGTTTQGQLDSIVAALVTLGLATDDR